MPTPFHAPDCKCNLCFVRARVAGVNPKQAGCEVASEQRAYCGSCLPCLVLAVALRGATVKAFRDVGFVQIKEKWELDPKRWTGKPTKTAPTADPKLPTV